MHNPNVSSQLNGINNTQGFSPIPQGNLKHARTHSLHRLRDIGFASFASNRQCSKADGSSLIWKRLEIL
jgi:hypothetical protein